MHLSDLYNGVFNLSLLIVYGHRLLTKLASISSIKTNMFTTKTLKPVCDLHLLGSL